MEDVEGEELGAIVVDAFVTEAPNEPEVYDDDPVEIEVDIFCI